MTTLRITKNTSAKVATCWNLLGDFEHIDAFNPSLSQSFLLTKDQATGVGAKRQCVMKDGKSFIREEVLEWKEGAYYTISIYTHSMPINNPVTTLGVMPATEGTQIYMEISYTPKFGVLGKIIDMLMLRRAIPGQLQNVVNGLAAKAEERENQIAEAA